LNHTYTLEIHAPIERAFACVDDAELMKIWMEGLVDTEYPDGIDKDHPVGTKFKQKIKEGGRVVEYDGEVLAYEKPRLLGVRIGNRMFSVDVFYQFEAIAEGTRLKYECRLTYHNVVAKMMGIMFGWLSKRILVKQMTALKALAEREK
jgi:uncharacterized protein YndB with AHSA1/START domain